MKPSAVVSEAVRNVATGATRASLFLIAMVLLLAGAVAVDAHALRGIYVGQREFLAAGGATTLIESEGNINPSRCAALSSVAGVRGSFAARPITSRIELATMPGTALGAREVTGNYIGTLGGQGQSAYGVGFARSYADKIGPLHPSDTLDLVSGTSTVSAVFEYPDDGRDPRYATSVFIAAPAIGTFDECVVTIWPVNSALEQLTYTVLEPHTDHGSVSVKQLNASFGPATATSELIQQRLTRFFPVVGAFLAVALGFSTMWLRRVECALALAVGMGKLALAVQSVIEALFWVVPAALVVSAGAVMTAATQLTAHETSALVSLVVMRTVAMCCAALVGVLIGVGSMAAHNLYRWFKDR